MSLKSNFNRLIEAITRYSYKLNNYTEESFQLKKHTDVWSPAEVYAHITTANRLTVKGMKKASNADATEDNSSLTWATRVIFLTGKFPAGRKAPDVIVKRTPELKSIADAKNALDELESELNEVWDMRHSWSKTQKLKHPALGMLNNEQWIKFMLIHSKHHLKQLDRIRAMK